MTADETGMGTVLHDDGRVGLRYRRRLGHPREKVWRALTESEHLRSWLPCDLVGERREGAPLELPFWPAHVERYGPEEPPLHGEVRVWQPPSVFEWTWDTDVLRWELEPLPDGTLLTFTTWLGDASLGGAGAAGTAAGWHVCLDHLVQLLDEGRVDPLDDAEVGRLTEHYAAEVGAPG